MTPRGDVGCAFGGGRGDADAAVAVEVALLPGGNVCGAAVGLPAGDAWGDAVGLLLAQHALTVTSAGAVIRLSGAGANIYAPLEFYPSRAWCKGGRRQADAAANIDIRICLCDLPRSDKETVKP